MILNMYLNECSDSMLVENLDINNSLNYINNILLTEASDNNFSIKNIKTKMLKLIEKLQNALKELWKKIKKAAETLFNKIKKNKNTDKKKDDSKEQIIFEFRSRYLMSDPIKVYKTALNMINDIDDYISYTNSEDIFKVRDMLEELNGKGVYERLECSKDAQVYNINANDLNLDKISVVTKEYNQIVDVINASYDKAKGVIKNTSEDIKYVAAHCNLILNVINRINSVCVGTHQDFMRAAKIALDKMEKDEN